MLWLLTLLLPNPSPPDPSADAPVSPLVAVHRAASTEEALEVVEKLLAPRSVEDPEGVHYLHGHLLEQLSRKSAASQAFASSIAYTPPLEQHSRLRLARLEAGRGHPELTAGLAASILRGDPPPALVGEATDLLIDALRTGGDCRLLAAIDGARLPDAQRRALSVARATCERSAGRTESARDLLLEVLDESETDEPARVAADELLALPPPAPSTATAELLGRAFHHHRRFDLALSYLEPLVARLPAEIRADDDFELYYFLARSHFRREDFRSAAEAFDQLAERVVRPAGRAQALYQAGRSLELLGDWDSARARFAAAAQVTPTSSWTGPAILSALRIDWRQGREEVALGTYATLRSRSGWARYAGQAALFLAVSDLVQQRTDRAAPWLHQAANHGADRTTVRYWQGRLAEATDRPGDALDAYRTLLVGDPHHPLARAVRARLRSPRLASAARERVARDRSAPDLDTRVGAWYLAADATAREALTQSIYQTLTRSSTAAPWVDLAPTSPDEWPLWQRSSPDRDALLLGLGRWDEVTRDTVLHHFPLRNAPLALAAAEGLYRVGETRSSLYLVEALRRRIPSWVPEPFLPLPFRRALYPVPHASDVGAASRNHGADAHLLLAVMREESRFDPHALSAAAARGLTQFILPTANRLARELGHPTPIDPDWLYEPGFAIDLGGAYLAELDREFDGRRPATVAAYNAGEHQARLWAAYCFSHEDEEFLSKVGFKETSQYLERVLRSWSQYSELYPDLVP